MERSVFFVVDGERIYIGTVGDVLSRTRLRELRIAVRDIVDRLAFSEDSDDYSVCSIEVR